VAKPVSSPFGAMEEEAYHAFREWHILLVLREKRLQTHLATLAQVHTPEDPAGAEGTGPSAVNDVETQPVE
jgi:hypothetical protein